MAEGSIVEIDTPDALFSNPKNERTKQFLGQILGH
jgi:general L-amino acid transport system ATP-binding protein